MDKKRIIEAVLYLLVLGVVLFGLDHYVLRGLNSEWQRSLIMALVAGCVSYLVSKIGHHNE